MSTRKLIAAAMACGLAILVAAAVWLFLERRDRQDAAKRETVLQPATEATVGDAHASALALRVVNGTYLVSVKMTVGESTAIPLSAASGWGLVTTGNGVLAVKPVAASLLSATPCEGVALSPQSSVTCDVAFGPAPTSGAGVVVVTYLHANTRASWQFATPS